MLWDLNRHQLKLLDRQRDEAWIGGPGINSNSMGWIDENTFWFQSEATGYSHLYTINVQNLQKQTLTSGNYEIQEAILSEDKNSFISLPTRCTPAKSIFTGFILLRVKKKGLPR